MDPAGTVTPVVISSTTPVVITTPVVTTVPGVVLSLIKLKRSDIASEYVIIAPNAMKASVDPLLKAKTGCHIMVWWLLRRRLLLSFRRVLQDPIKGFLTYAWNNGRFHRAMWCWLVIRIRFRLI